MLTDYLLRHKPLRTRLRGALISNLVAAGLWTGAAILVNHLRRHGLLQPLVAAFNFGLAVACLICARRARRILRSPLFYLMAVQDEFGEKEETP